MEENMTKDRNQTKRVLPEAISDKFRTLAVEMRMRPRPIAQDGEETINISEGLATVLNAGGSKWFEQGMMFQLSRRFISARKIEIKPMKYRGSGNHHKFLVVIHDGMICRAEGGAAL
ncbi:MAG: hypothetical protein Q7J68_04430 [Thermoplasmata archaeon]|nr:hypothetical protein [Thermoplasmata archaeon]